MTSSSDSAYISHHDHNHDHILSKKYTKKKHAFNHILLVRSQISRKPRKSISFGRMCRRPIKVKLAKAVRGIEGRKRVSKVSKPYTV
jgi:hypothetical protein